ncbi:MAG: thrombospondin type 3 repeat-containing protein [Myxococcota bacterium]
MKLTLCLASSFLVANLALGACSDDAKTGTDTAVDTTSDVGGDATSAADSSPTTATDTTADSQADVGLDTTVAPDSGDATVADTGDDVGADTGDAADGDATAECMYFEEPRLLECGDDLGSFLYWQDFGEAGCPAYYTAGDQRFDTLAELAAAKGCNADCEYIARISVDVLGCLSGHRTGFDEYSADGEGCLEAVYNTPIGPLKDICDWQERACYCTDGDNDTIVDGEDNCPADPNPSQDDGDFDGVGDACDPCLADPDNDVDQDGVCGDVDNCPSISNPPSDCDSNAATPPTQCDSNDNGVGDVCEP